MAKRKQVRLDLHHFRSNSSEIHHHSDAGNQFPNQVRSTKINMATADDEDDGHEQVSSMVVDAATPDRRQIDLPQSTEKPSQQLCEWLVDLLCRAVTLGPNTEVIQKSIELCHAMGINPSSQCLEGICRSIINSANSPELSDSISTNLTATAHTVLDRLSSSQRFYAAIEESARRQFYNFAYGLTHEINNPLANISARAEQLLRDEPDARNQKSLATIVDQSFRAHDMLAEVMRIVQPMQLRISSHRVFDWLNKSTTGIAAKCQSRDVEFSVDCDLQLVANFDQNELAAAINSCLENSLEACSPGESISIIARRLAHPESISFLIIEITDTGRGISAEGLKNAKDLYFSGRESGRGLGLGMSKAQRIVTAHGGELDIESQQKAFARVRFKIPI